MSADKMERSEPLITSRSNPLVVRVASLSERKYRREYGSFFFEGFKLLSDAVQSGIVIDTVFFTEKSRERCYDILPEDYAGKIVAVTESVYDKMSFEKSPEGVLCTVKRLDNLHKYAKMYSNEHIGTKFIACKIRDPGNMGTIIRTANALGIDELLISEDCADIYNPRAIRGAMGALFRQRITVCSDICQAARELKGNGYDVLATVLDERARKLNDIAIDDRTCFAVGNEGQGLPRDFISECNGSVIIPMMPGCESLNAASAASIMLWEMGKSTWMI